VDPVPDKIPLREWRYSLDKRLGVAQSRSGRCGKETILALPGKEVVPSGP
jgi:hypothetical protein